MRYENGKCCHSIRFPYNGLARPGIERREPSNSQAKHVFHKRLLAPSSRRHRAKVPSTVHGSVGKSTERFEHSCQGRCTAVTKTRYPAFPSKVFDFISFALVFVGFPAHPIVWFNFPRGSLSFPLVFVSLARLSFIFFCSRFVSTVSVYFHFFLSLPLIFRELNTSVCFSFVWHFFVNFLFHSFLSSRLASQFSKLATPLLAVFSGLRCAAKRPEVFSARDSFADKFFVPLKTESKAVGAFNSPLTRVSSRETILLVRISAKIQQEKTNVEQISDEMPRRIVSNGFGIRSADMSAHL